MALNKILEECATAPGFVVFAGFLTKDVDDQGNPIIQFRYQRHKVSFEDTKLAVNAFRNSLKDDMNKFVDEEDAG